MASLAIANAWKKYGEFLALRNINLDIKDGEFVVLVGPSGCGKSTLLSIIAGLEETSHGTLMLGDKDVTDLSAKDRNIAMVFQSYALYPNMTVRGNISFGMEMHGIAKPERAKRIDQVADLLQITHLLDRKPGQLSGGQRQRVAMGRALVREPDIFLFDEPLSNLDAKLRVDMRTEIKKLHQKLGTTIVYVTHDQIEALTLSTRIAVMYGGFVQQLGTPKEIYDNPANMFVAGFMGSPSMNLFPAKVVSLNGKPAAEVALVDSTKAAIPFASDQLSSSLGRDIILGIRPEAITDLDGADRNSRAIHVVETPVEVTEPAGSDTFVVSQISGKDVTARFRADVAVNAGDVYPFAFNMEKAVVFDPQSENRIA
ncbi:MAG: ABC transporter ATP-binding protein [Roseibium sp.]